MSAVKEDKTIEMMEPGKPDYCIVPQKQSLEEKLEAMRKAGLIQWSGKKLQPLEPIGEVIGERIISDLVVENRERD